MEGIVRNVFDTPGKLVIRRGADWYVPEDRVARSEAVIKCVGHHRRARALPLKFGGGTALAVR